MPNRRDPGKANCSSNTSIILTLGSRGGEAHALAEGGYSRHLTRSSCKGKRRKGVKIQPQPGLVSTDQGHCILRPCVVLRKLNKSRSETVPSQLPRLSSLPLQRRLHMNKVMKKPPLQSPSFRRGYECHRQTYFL